VSIVYRLRHKKITATLFLLKPQDRSYSEHIENIRSFVRRKTVIFNNILIIKEPRMSAFVSNCHFTVYFGEISPKHSVYLVLNAKEDPLSFDSMRPPASVLLIAVAGDDGPFHGA